MTTTAGTITFAAITEEQRYFYELTMLERAIPNFLHIWFGLEGTTFPVTSIPENSGMTVQWNKLASLTAVTTPLTEGVTPDPQFC